MCRPYTSVETGADAIKHVFTGDENYAITLTGQDTPIGCIEPKRTDASDHTGRFVRESIDEGRPLDSVDANAVERALEGYDHDRVLGYWTGRPFWGKD